MFRGRNGVHTLSHKLFTNVTFNCCIINYMNNQITDFFDIHMSLLKVKLINSAMYKNIDFTSSRYIINTSQVTNPRFHKFIYHKKMV